MSSDAAMPNLSKNDGAPVHAVVIPRPEDGVDDLDGPWVLTYRDHGPVGYAPGGGWPSAFAIFFPDYESARDYWDKHKEQAGRNPSVDLLPIRMPSVEHWPSPGGRRNQ
jgi:hypothetical protein